MYSFFKLLRNSTLEYKENSCISICMYITCERYKHIVNGNDTEIVIIATMILINPNKSTNDN